MSSKYKYERKALILGFFAWALPVWLFLLAWLAYHEFYITQRSIAEKPFRVINLGDKTDEFTINHNSKNILADELWVVRVASFKQLGYAEAMHRILKNAKYKNVELKREQHSGLYVVQVGPFIEKHKAKVIANQIAKIHQILPKLQRILNY